METLINSKYTKSSEQNTYLNSGISKDPAIDAYSRIVIEATNKVSPAVVQITTNMKRGQTMQQGGTGSGFLISSEGFIVTNSHVVNGAHELLANLPDGTSHQAEVKG